MNFRTISLPGHKGLQVPQGIQRIDSKSTHGWQVRYAGTKFFSDGPAANPRDSLQRATKELLTRMATTPAPLPLRQKASPRKHSALPVGIFGPIVRYRPGRAAVAELSVLLPRVGSSPKIKNIYIGSENTYTIERYQAALAKGLALRAQATEQYERDAAKAQRQSVKQLRTYLQALQA